MEKQGNARGQESRLDMVGSPPHYLADPSGVECIEIIEQMNSTVLANTVRYLWRYLHKWNAPEDCDKAIWYIRRFWGGPGLKSPRSDAWESEPFVKWRHGTTPSLASAAITMIVLIDSGRCHRGDASMMALMDIVEQMRKEAASVPAKG